VGISVTTVCARCNVDAPEVGDFGYIGLPSLESKRTRKHTQPFGCLYAGLAALGLLTEEIEAFHAFLREHRGHPIRQFSDAEGAEFEDDVGEQDDVAPAPASTEKFVFRKGTFVEAFHELRCEACGEVQRARESARLRPFATRTLTKKELKLFQTNCGDLEANTYRVGGFPYDDAAAIARFVRRHAAHVIVVRLDARGDSLPPPALRAPATAALAWTPPEWSPDEYEETLGRPKDAKVRAALLRLRHCDRAVRAEALAVLRERADAAAFAHVAMMWRDPDAEVRAAAAAAIGVLDDPRKTRVLGHALLDESEDVRSAALASLHAAGIDPGQAAAMAAMPRAPDTRPELKNHPDDSKALRAALLDPDSGRRTKAVERLAKHKGKEAVDLLLEALADPDTYVRKTATESLASHAKRDPRVPPALIQALDDYADWVVEAAVKAVGNLKLEAAVRPIHERLMSTDAHSSTKIEALAQIGGPLAIAALGDAVSHASAHVRAYALHVLGTVGTADAAGHAVKALADPDESVRLAAAHALGEMKGGRADAALVAGYRSPSKWHRHTVVGALGKLGGPAALRVLVAALRDRSPEVRAAAATGLARLNDPRGNRALISAAKRGDGAVAAEAWQFLLGQGEPGTEGALVSALGRDDGTQVAACFLQCGNSTLAKRARLRLQGRRPPQGAPSIRWGSRRK
jgi:HEAT repeat protein